MSGNMNESSECEFEIILKKCEKKEGEKILLECIKLKFMDLNSLLLSLIITNDRVGALELIKQGADPNAKFSNRRTPLSESIRLDHCDMMLMLLNNGAKVDEECRGGTALFTALDNVINHEILDSYITHLLLHGAQLNVKNYDDETPIEFTLRREGYRMFRYDSQIEKLLAFACLHNHLEKSDYRAFGIGENTRLDSKRQECIDQLIYMQQVGDDNGDHNYYGILVSKGNKLMRLAANKKLRKNVYTSQYLNSQFHYYCDIVIEKFVIALKRYNAYLLLVNEQKMLPEIAKMICENLSDYDVRYHSTWEMDLPELNEDNYYE